MFDVCMYDKQYDMHYFIELKSNFKCFRFDYTFMINMYVTHNLLIYDYGSLENW
jgi:hypothetical protein